MVDLNKLQRIANKQAIKLGYKTDKESILDKLLIELEELKEAKKQNNVSMSYTASCIRDDKQFVKYYEKNLKDTTQDEAPDIILVILSYLQDEGLDSETLLMNKMRYNRLRKRKFDSQL